MSQHRAGRAEQAKRTRRRLRRAIAHIERELERNAGEARDLRRRRAERLAELEAINAVLARTPGDRP